MALPSTQPQFKEHTIMGTYFLFLSFSFFFIAPLVAIIPISFSQSPFMLFTEGMMTWPPDPEAWSLRWYRYMVGICTDKVLTTPCSNKWMVGTVNSFLSVLFQLLLLQRWEL